MSDPTAFLEIHIYTDGRKVAFFGAPSRPSYLPSSEYVGLVNQDPRLGTGEYAVDLSRFALRSGGETATWLAVYRGRPDPVLGDRGTYVGAGLWMIDNPAIAIDTVLDALRMIVDRVVDIMDSDPSRSSELLNAQLPEYANGAVNWLRESAIGGSTDKDLGLVAGDGAPLDARRALVRVRNAFGADAMNALSAAMIVRIRNGATRLLMVQSEEALSEEASNQRTQTFERLFGTHLPLNALNHHALNFSRDASVRERQAREAAASSAASLSTLQAEHASLRAEFDLTQQSAERSRLDHQRSESALKQEREQHQATKTIASQAEKLRLENERLNAEYLAYKARVKKSGEAPSLAKDLRNKVNDAVQSRPQRRSGARRVRQGADVQFYQRNKLIVYGVLGVIVALILGSMAMSYFRDKPADAVQPMNQPALPQPVQQPGVIESTNTPAPGEADPAATLPQPQVVN